MAIKEKRSKHQKIIFSGNKPGYKRNNSMRFKKKKSCFSMKVFEYLTMDRHRQKNTHSSVTPALSRLGQKDCFEFKTSLSYGVRSCLINK